MITNLSNKLKKKKIQIWDRYLFFNVCWIALQYLAERRQNVTEFLDVAMATFLPTEYAERSRIYDEDMQKLASSSNVCLYIKNILDENYFTLIV